MLEEKTSGCRSAVMMSSFFVSRTPRAPLGMSIDMTGMSARRAWKTGCGFAAISGSMPPIGFSP